jgi:putative transposase
MPAINIIKTYAEDQYYHVYNRGVNKQRIFYSDKDYRIFLAKLKKLLSEPGPHYVGDRVELVAYCLMPNHFHLMFRTITADGVETTMRRLMTSYVMYINRVHRRVGRLFQGVYKASHIADEAYFAHITRYIHLNPHRNNRPYTIYEYSSFKYYSGEYQSSWVKPELMDMTTQAYKAFCDDYLDHKEQLEIIKYLLANPD